MNKIKEAIKTLKKMQSSKLIIELLEAKYPSINTVVEDVLNELRKKLSIKLSRFTIKTNTTGITSCVLNGWENNNIADLNDRLILCSGPDAKIVYEENK